MRNLIIIILTILVMIGCSDDDKVNNLFIYKGQEYKLEDARIVYSGLEAGGALVSIELISDGLTFVTNGDYWIQYYRGQGDYISFGFLSTSKTTIPNGTYDVIEIDINDPITNSFILGDLFINYSIDYTVEEYTHSDFATGRICITLNENSIILDFEGEDENGNLISCYYKGSCSKEVYN